MAKCRGGKPAEHNTYCKIDLADTSDSDSRGFACGFADKKWVDSAPGGITVATWDQHREKTGNLPRKNI